MKKINFLAIVAIAGLIATISTTSCSKENKETVFACDSASAKYSTTIKTILNNSCNSCHSTANAASLGGSKILDTYDDVMNSVDTTNLTDTFATLDNSGLYSSVAAGRMPKGGTKLSACDMAKIKYWILAGAKNN